MKSFLISIVCTFLGGCASIPSFTMLDGETVTSKVTVYDLAKQKDVDIPLTIYKPKIQPSSKPAILFLSGCDGGHWNVHKALAKEFNQKGVVVAEVRSIDAYGNQCIKTDLMGWRRSDHAFAAQELLVKQGLANADNMALVGLSHGGWTAVHVSKMDAQNAKQPFSAIVSLYPWCDLNIPSHKSSTPMLVLGGSADTWTPVDKCVRYLSDDPKIEIHVYNDTTHAWDAPFGPRTRATGFGSTFMAYDYKVTEDSIQKSREFLLKHLKF